MGLEVGGAAVRALLLPLLRGVADGACCARAVVGAAWEGGDGLADGVLLARAAAGCGVMAGVSAGGVAAAGVAVAVA